MTTTRPLDDAVPAQPASDTAPASFRKSLRFMVASFLLRREVPGKQVDLSVGIALGDLVHDGGGALALLEGLHLRHQEGKRRSEEHTSELQSHHDLVCRLLLEKKKKSLSKYEAHSPTNRRLSRPLSSVEKL